MNRLTFKKWFKYYKPDEETTTISIKGYTQITEQTGVRGEKSFYLVGEAVDKLAEYEDAEEQGLLFKFPCKVGNYVYFQSLFYENVERAEVLELHVGKFAKGISIYNPKIGTIKISINEIGKYVFFTKEEAEAALKKMKGE